MWKFRRIVRRFRKKNKIKTLSDAARGYIEGMDFENAERTLKSLRALPDGEFSYLNISVDLRRKEGHAEGAIFAARTLISGYGEKAEGYIKLINIFLNEKDISEAWAIVQTVPSSIADEYGFLSAMRSLLRASKQIEMAFYFSKRAVYLYPDKRYNHIMLAHDAATLGHRDLAVTALNKVEAEMGVEALTYAPYIYRLISACGVVTANKKLSAVPHNTRQATSGGLRPVEGYLFLSGMPRSGTTALGRMFNLSKDIALMVELHSQHLPYSAASFDDEFVERQATVGHHRRQNVPLIEKFRSARYVGDKRTLFFYRMDHTLELMKDEKLFIFHIVRPLFDVCQSYESRAQKREDRNWRAEWNVVRAVEEYNLMCEYFVERRGSAFAENHHFEFVPYNRVFSDLSYAWSLFEKMALSNDVSLRNAVVEFVEGSAEIVGAERSVPDDVKHYVERHANLAAIRAFEELTGIACL